ncbi:transporter substrate-binding domain-containing protein [Aquincola agrisoli]|uniref:transporter substrate-binding domain-containing protein n=1 Tax=Aquincola agrisoli TaxID=3119538 RepID=UPI002FBEBD7F
MLRSTGALALLVCGLFLLPGEAMAQDAATAARSPLHLTDAQHAWIARHPVVRVGMSTESPPYYFADRQGRYEGFVIELMNRLAERAGLRMEYHRYARFGDTLQAMQRGEIDLTPFTAETASRRELLHFVRPLFSTQMVYVADRRLGDVTADARFSGYRVAAERLSTAAELLAEHYPQARVQHYDSAEQALLAVASGEADVFIGFRQVAVYYMEKHLTANLALRGAIATPGTALGPAVRKDLPELAAILDQAVAGLGTDEIAAVAAKWLPRSVLGADVRPQTTLTDAQRAWIRAHGSLRVGFDAAFAPIAFTSLAGGFDGLAADITRAVAGKVGLIVAVEESGSFADVYARALRGDIDVIAAAARNNERGRDFDFVGPFLRVPTVVVAASDRDLDAGLDAPGRRRLALLREHFLLPLLRSRHPNLALQEYATQAEVLQAVRRGDAELAIGNMKVVNELLEARHAGALRTIGTVPQGDSELYFAVRKSLPEMAGVLRAGLDAMTPAERAAIDNRWLRVQLNQGVPWGRVLAIGAAGTALAGLVIGSLWIGNRRLRQAQRTLDDARRLAEEQVAARAAFTAYLSHELRGTLGGIVGGLGLLEAGAMGADRQRQLLGAMRASSGGLLDLCERTLDFERMLQGGLDLQPAPVLLKEVIDTALAPWRVQAELKGLALQASLRFAPDLRVHCDAVRLTQVLQNLVGNAVKFTVKGSVEMAVAVERGGPAGLVLRVTVADTGPGIAADDVAQLFSAFTQGEAGRRSRRGAGLGLSICARIVSAMGGTIELAESSFAGSTFALQLPLRRAPTAGVDAPAAADCVAPG